jgi:hypothetical protein
MRALLFSVLLILLVSDSEAQIGKLASDLISEMLVGGEIDNTLFRNYRHSSNCVFVILNNVIESDSSQRFSPKQHEARGYIVLFYPRKSIAGYEIKYWIEIDRIEATTSTACLSFRIITSENNWFEEYDKVYLSGNVTFLQVDGSWKVSERSIRRFKNTD